MSGPRWFRRPRGFAEKFGRNAECFGSGRRRGGPGPERALPLLFASLSLLVLSLCTLLAGRAAKVTEVHVPDARYYAASEIAERAGIRPGDGLWGFDASAAEARLRRACPMLDRVRVRRRGRGRVSIGFSERGTVYATRHHVNHYLIDARTRETLAVYPDDAEALRVGAVYLGLPEAARVRVGERLTFARPPYGTPGSEDGPADYGYVLDFADRLEAAEDLRPRLTGMETGDRYDLWIVLDGYIRVRFGGPDGTDRKLEALRRLLADPDRRPSGELPVLIDVSDASRAVFRESADVPLPPWALRRAGAPERPPRPEM